MTDMDYDPKASGAAAGGLYSKKLSHCRSSSRDSYSSRDSRETCSQDTQVNVHACILPRNWSHITLITRSCVAVEMLTPSFQKGIVLAMLF